MQIGYFLIGGAFLMTLLSGWYYFTLARQQDELNITQKKKFKLPQNKHQLARTFYNIAVLFVTAAAAYLMVLILTHQFQFSYVYRYSSLSLPGGFLVSTFWAGQEGSFLLWTFFIALMGILMMRTAGKFEFHAMAAVNVVQAFFLLILIKASPFELLPQTPPDGSGLNPLLQNFWMVIHPPVLFIGYAAATFPFALAIAALARREYQQFATKALPWVLITSVTLGAGIIIGGYWAYKTLGWGGYWGWDPVENSSLVPWLTTLALLHGLLIQRFKTALQKTNFLLAIFTLGLVLYATFLTRSGVLADFSVHSFTDLGINAYLIVFIVAVLAIGLITFQQRRWELRGVAIDFNSLNRESVLLGGMVLFSISAAMVFLGTSSPIFTGFFGTPAQVGISFYNSIHLPLGILIALLLGVAPFMRWGDEGFSALLKKATPALFLTGASTGIAIFFGMTSPLYLIFTASAFFAFWSNALITVQAWQYGWKMIGAPLSHVGVALLLVGIIISGVLESKERVVLPKGTPTAVMDYQMTYTGMTSVPNSKDIMNIDVTADQAVYKAVPRFYMSEYNKSMMGEPDVKANLFYDIYIAPLERRNAEPSHAANAKRLFIKKGETKMVDDYEVLFETFEMGTHEQGGDMKIGARLRMKGPDGEFSIAPAVAMISGKRQFEPATFNHQMEDSPVEVSVMLHRINADQKAVELLFRGMGVDQPAAAAEELVFVDVSRIPFMNVLWLGTILILAGAAIALKRRMEEWRPEVTPEHNHKPGKKGKKKVGMPV